jgi:hypothetical protein
VPDRWHSAKKENKLLARSSSSPLALSVTPRRLPAAASAPPRAGNSQRPCSPIPARAPRRGRARPARRAPPTRAPARPLAAAATHRAGPLCTPAPSPRPCPPRPLARRATASPPATVSRYKFFMVLFVENELVLVNKQYYLPWFNLNKHMFILM